MAIFASFVHLLSNILHTWPHKWPRNMPKVIDSRITWKLSCHTTAFRWYDCQWPWAYFKVIGLFHIKFLKNGVWDGKSYCRQLIGNHTLAFLEVHLKVISSWVVISMVVHFSNPWHAFASHGLPAIAELIVRHDDCFTAQCTLVQSAGLRSHVVRPSVHLSVRPSVTLVDCDHICWKSWKLIAQTISPTPSLFAAKRRFTYSHRGTWGIFWEIRGGVGNMPNGVLENKYGNSSGTRKDGGKVTMEDI